MERGARALALRSESGEANFYFAREWTGDGLSGGEKARHGGTATAILVRRGRQGTAGRVSRSRGARGSGFERNRGHARWFGRGRGEGAARGRRLRRTPSRRETEKGDGVRAVL